MKKVLLTTNQKAYLYYGGGEKEIYKLRDVLNEAGFIADIYGPDSSSVQEYDINIHFSTSLDSMDFLQSIRKEVDTMILWPNMWFIDRIQAEVQAGLQKLISLFDTVVFKTTAERKHFQSFFSIDEEKIIYIHPGIDARFSSAKNNSLFRDVYGQENYILCTGIIEPQKNQLAVIESLKDTDAKVVISGAVRDSAYYELCLTKATENFLFIPEMPFLSEIHLSALMNCNLFLELPFDFPGISAIEAAYLGAPLILNDSEWTHEIFGEDASYVSPHNQSAIKEMVMYKLNHLHTDRVDKDKYTKFLLPAAYFSLIEKIKLL